MPFRYSQGISSSTLLVRRRYLRQNLGGESKLVTLLIHAAVVDSWSAYLQRADTADEGSFVGLSVAHVTKRRPCSSIFVVVCVDVGGGFGLDGLQQHAPTHRPGSISSSSLRSLTEATFGPT